MMLPDRNHLHHIFLRAGFSEREALVLITCAAAVMAGVGIIGELVALPEWLMFAGFLALFAGYNMALSHIWRLTALVRQRVKE